MDAIKAQDAYDQILAYIHKQKGAYKDWYAGIASDWDTRLFTEHKVARKNSWYIARQCTNDLGARNVEKELLKLGCDGDEGGGDETSVYVYAYLKTIETDP